MIDCMSTGVSAFEHLMIILLIVVKRTLIYLFLCWVLAQRRRSGIQFEKFRKYTEETRKLSLKSIPISVQLISKEQNPAPNKSCDRHAAVSCLCPCHRPESEVAGLRYGRRTMTVVPRPSSLSSAICPPRKATFSYTIAIP